jgi:hypothetical protein
MVYPGGKSETAKFYCCLGFLVLGLRAWAFGLEIGLAALAVGLYS